MSILQCFQIVSPLTALKTDQRVKIRQYLSLDHFWVDAGLDGLLIYYVYMFLLNSFTNAIFNFMKILNIEFQHFSSLNTIKVIAAISLINF